MLVTAQRHASVGAEVAATPSAATNRLQVLRDTMMEDTQQFQYAMEKKAAALRHHAKALQQNLFVLDQHVSHEARKRTECDDALARLVDARMRDASQGYLSFLERHCQQVASNIAAVDQKAQALTEDTLRQRNVQEQLLDVVRDDFHTSTADLHQELNSIQMRSVEFETRFAPEVARRVALMDDSMTVELSVQHRMSSDVLGDVKALLNQHNDAQRIFEAEAGSLLNHLRNVQARLRENVNMRVSASEAFEETMNSMVCEVQEAVKKMNLPRGVDQIFSKRNAINASSSSPIRIYQPMQSPVARNRGTQQSTTGSVASNVRGVL